MKILLSIKRNGAPAKAVAKVTHAKCKHRFLRTSLVLQAPHEVLPAAECAKCGLYIVLPARNQVPKVKSEAGIARPIPADGRLQ